jgi:hypothetical protein
MRTNTFLASLLLSTASLSASALLPAQSAFKLTALAQHGFDRAHAQTDTERYQLTAQTGPGSSDITWSLAATGDTVSTRRVSVYESDPDECTV